MVITFYGEGCFKIQSGDFSILTDVFENKTGLTPPRFKTDIILKTLSPLPLTDQSAGQPETQLIYGPGEYDLKGINVTGIPLPKESSENFLKTVYLVKMEGINLCFLGHISEMPDPSVLEYLEEIDVLFVPAGGTPFLNQKSSVKLVKQIQPKIVIPCFFKIPSLKRPAGKIEEFLEEFNGQKGKQAESKEKFLLKKKDLAETRKTEIVILKP